MKKYTKESIIESIQRFYEINDRIPNTRDFAGSLIYPSFNTIKRHFGSWNYAIQMSGFSSKNQGNYTKEKIIKAIQDFYRLNNRIPTTVDFHKNIKYPSFTTVQKYFITWNNAIEAAGFEPNTKQLFGVHTYGRDGHLYRSQAEAYFADNYLFNKVEYEIEPKYPYPHYRFYDWYITELDLYIELDGGIRPEITKQKIEINKRLNRHCLLINTSEVSKFKSLEDFIVKERKLYDPENSNE